MPLAPIILKGQAKMLEPIVTLLMALYTMLEEKSIGAVYGIPVNTYQDLIDFYPQVKLMFYQTQKEANGKPEATGEITFRLMGETEATFNEAKAIPLAEKIKTKFATPVFVWNKGKTICRYEDQRKGYDFRLYVSDETEAKKIIEQVMDIQGHSPDWELLRTTTTGKNFPATPSRRMIYGVSRRPPRRRPAESMKFRYAELHIWGLPHAVSLVDTTGYRPAPLVSIV